MVEAQQSLKFPAVRGRIPQPPGHLHPAVLFLAHFSVQYVRNQSHDGLDSRTISTLIMSRDILLARGRVANQTGMIGVYWRIRTNHLHSDSVFSVKANLSRHCRSEEDRYTHCEIWCVFEYHYISYQSNHILVLKGFFARTSRGIWGQCMTRTEFGMDAKGMNASQGL